MLNGQREELIQVDWALKKESRKMSEGFKDVQLAIYVRSCGSQIKDIATLKFNSSPEAKHQKCLKTLTVNFPRLMTSPSLTACDSLTLSQMDLLTFSPKTSKRWQRRPENDFHQPHLQTINYVAKVTHCGKNINRMES